MADGGMADGAAAAPAEASLVLGSGAPPVLVTGSVSGKYVTWSEALGSAILERVAAGESVLQVCRGAAMPHPTTVYAWTRERAGFGAALAEAQKTARVAARIADRARAAARAAAGRDGRGRWSTYTPEMGETICARLADGESLKAIGADPEMPCAATILNWARAYPEFGDAYAQARQMMADVLFDEAREVALAATPRSVWADRLRFDTIRWMTARMAPRKYCERLMVDIETAAVRGERDRALSERARQFLASIDEEGEDGDDEDGDDEALDGG